MNETLVIHDVDLEQLEQQRRSFNQAMWAIEEGRLVPLCLVEDLRGLENMLDQWSDVRHREQDEESIETYYSPDDLDMADR